VRCQYKEKGFDSFGSKNIDVSFVYMSTCNYITDSSVFMNFNKGRVNIVLAIVSTVCVCSCYCVFFYHCANIDVLVQYIPLYLTSP